MKINIINGPNLNLLGKREPEIYGSETFVSFFERLSKLYPQLDLNYFQSNSEGAIIDKLHDIGFSSDGIILNAGAYSHTSLAIADAIKAIPSPVVEVHISNVFARESYRHHSWLSANCAGVIVGCGMEGYQLAIEFFRMRDQQG